MRSSLSMRSPVLHSIHSVIATPLCTIAFTLRFVLWTELCACYRSCPPCRFPDATDTANNADALAHRRRPIAITPMPWMIAALDSI
ncbi:hypothetical protein [cf. Phormidesmis sp. LEGE 11477]|uniref:hypothetical protein n=1 Tax=cf. Phormidesmis sp. LEGE 11477 TaxID=1828680 RepID=UPI0018815563|nr:hypothetical protein [cf. Phormidesmis sp. LEGE 11477]MBE9064957.1 hypothetical protein [cf. Phormidesmis sp. LEGE 11477]